MPIVFYVSIQGKIRIDVDHQNFCKDPKNTDKIELYILSTFLTASMLHSAVLEVEKFRILKFLSKNSSNWNDELFDILLVIFCKNILQKTCMLAVNNEIHLRSCYKKLTW